MSNHSGLYIFLIALCLSSLAKAEGLEFKVLNGEKRELDPGSSFNVMLKITNSSDSLKTFRITITTKGSSFKPLLDYSSLTINQKTTFNKIIGISIPSNCSAGEYDVGIELIDNQTLLSAGMVSLSVLIKPRIEIDLIKGSAPKFLMAGDTLTLYSTIQNLSNQEVTVKSTVNFESNIKTDIWKIPQGSSRVVKTFISIPKDVTTHTRKMVLLSVVIPEKSETEKSTNYAFDAFPSKDVKFDRYNRFPIRISSMMVGTNRWGGLRYSNMFDIQGAGKFGKKKDQTVQFTIRGPNRSGNPLLGLNDAYSVKYTSKLLEVSLGDDNFGLSELTESSRIGQGIKLFVKPGKWTLGGFYNRPKYYPVVKQVYSVSGGFNFNENNYLRVGMLSKVDTIGNIANVFSFSATNKPFRWFRSNVEIAMSPVQDHLSKSFKTTLAASHSIFTSYFNFVYADPDFSGYIANSQRLSTGTSINLKKVNLSFNYNFNRTNFLALDTFYLSKPFSKDFNLMLGYRIIPSSIVMIGAVMNNAEDRSPIPLFNYTKYNGRFSFQSNLKKLSLSFQGDYGKMINFLKSGDNEALNYSASLNSQFKISSLLTANTYINYMGAQQNITGYDKFYYGGSLIANNGKDFSLNLQYNSNFEWLYFTSDRSLLAANLSKTINDKNRLIIGVNYNLKKNTLDKKEITAQIRYIYTLNVPISIRKDVGNLAGRIMNHGVPTIKGIRLSLNGIVVITDKDGNFKFPAVPVGSAILTIDESSMGLNAIAERSGPYIMEIAPGKTTFFELAVTKSAIIEGKLEVKEDENTSQKGFISVNQQLGKLIIEASNDVEVYRVYTNEAGSFRFNDLRPGDWKVKVYTTGLPQGYQIQTTQYEVSLSPGMEKEIEIPVIKKARQIQFQQPIKK